MVLKKTTFNLKSQPLNKKEKNTHTLPKFSNTGKKTPSTFILAKLLLKLFTTDKSILLLT